MRPDDADMPTITPEMIADTEREIAKRREGKQGSALKDIKNMRCRVCGENAVSFVDDLMIRIGGTTVPNLTGLRCAVCGDYSFDADASKIISDMRQRQRLELIPVIPDLADDYRDVLNEEQGYTKGDELMRYVLIGNLPDGASIEYVKGVVRTGFGDDATIRQVLVGDD